MTAFALVRVDTAAPRHALVGRQGPVVLHVLHQEIERVLRMRPVLRSPGPRISKADARARPPSRLPWAELLRRVFREGLLAYDRCGGRRVVLAFLSEGSVVKAILEHLGLPTTGPPVAPARGSPQTEFAPWPDDSPQCQ